MHITLLLLLAAMQGKAEPRQGTGIETVTIHPFASEVYACTEHPEGQLEYIGDALGTDCIIMGGLDEKVGGFMRSFRTDGSKNEDWYGWDVPVLAPFDGKVARVMDNPVVNAPGRLGKPPAGMIMFERADGTRVILAHVQKVTVKAGDAVKAGQQVATVGNNGMSRSPHIHVGAFRGKRPLQIRWDLRALGELHGHDKS